MELRPIRPWVRMKRKPAQGRDGTGAATQPRWVYLTIGEPGTGREHATTAVERVGWPQRCDQCGGVIALTPEDGTRSFAVSRGLRPTTLYLCGGCVRDLCAAGGIPAPDGGS